MVKTGYFGRAPGEGGKRGCVSRVHLVFAENDKPLCKYRPHETMRFQICACGPHLPYVECSGCRKTYEKLEKALAEKKTTIKAIEKKYGLKGVLLS